MPALAQDLGANSHTVEWSVEQEDDQPMDFRCRVQCTFGRHNSYHAGSYVSKFHPFEEVENSIREMHAKWKVDNARYERKLEEDAIKQRLYEEHIAKQDKALMMIDNLKNVNI